MEPINLKSIGKAIPELYQYETFARVNDHTFTMVRVKDRTLDFHSPVCTTEVVCLLIEQACTLTPENTGGTYKKDS